MECRPTADVEGKVFFVFPEYHDYQRWWKKDEIRAKLAGKSPAFVVDSEVTGAGLKSDDVAVACARLAKAFYGCPDESIPVIGVTGTNGKTTTSHLIYQALGRLTASAGSVGTLGTFLNGRLVAVPEYTTDLSVELYRKLASLWEEGAQAIAMEVSSHALALDRVAAVQWKAAVLTNVTRDHLDFHGSLDAYQKAKGLLFRSLGPEAVAVFPTASPVTPEFVSQTSATVVTYGKEPWADLRLIDYSAGASGTEFCVEWRGERAEPRTSLVGYFQLQNLMAAGATLLGLGYAFEDSWKALSELEVIPGRMERIDLPSGASAVIDYAHNPDGLEVVLDACRQLEPRSLHVVFGCGGDRDCGKRAMMGEISKRLADRIWLTSDNPRGEDPHSIIEDIQTGLKSSDGVTTIEDRRVAILAALDSAEEGDLVLIAGKGHEDYQIIGDAKHPFSDRVVVEDWIRLHGER